MANVLIINAHHHYPFAEGKLNQAMVDISAEELSAKGYNIKHTHTDSTWNVDEELEKHQWADYVILQSPVNWMMVPWTFKKYMDEVYTAGMGGTLCNGDGRHRETPKENYGMGGTLKGVKYMMSLTFNAPEESFDDPKDFFDGKSVDDLFFPMHANFKFFAMEPMPTFACFDVMKNADFDADMNRFKQHLNANF